MAAVRGAVEVELVCDECGKREWHTVALDDCEKCVEYEAAIASDTWNLTSDSLLCSEDCERRFWDDW